MFFPSRCIKIFFILGNLYELSHATVEGSIRGDCLAFTKTKTEEYHEVLDCETSLPPLLPNEGILIGLVISGILVILTGIGAFSIVRIRKRMHNHGKHNGSLTDSEPVVTTGRPNSNYTNATSEQVDSLPENDYNEVATADRPHSAYDILNPEQVNNLPENHYNELAIADRPQSAYDILNPEEVNNLPENHYKELNTVHDYMEIIE
ncbi:uncharacterized protein LOC134256374 [Saccostrea cucullata]|uniref:uncharacterized protein LOC134256374 n=1 Tax=Saccostrea cuccullata TaxID=36930 RepID=UPI002ED0A9BC